MLSGTEAEPVELGRTERVLERVAETMEELLAEALGVTEAEAPDMTLLMWAEAEEAADATAEEAAERMEETMAEAAEPPLRGNWPE